MRILPCFAALVMPATVLVAACGPREQPTPPPPPVEAVQPFDLIIQGGTIIDGSGHPRFMADIGIRGERIAAIGQLADYPANRRVTAAGRFVVPGFINPHSHIDAALEEDPDLEASLLQGITTELVGMDGESPVQVADYLRVVEDGGIPVNYGVLVGQGAIRRYVRGNTPGSATAPQIKAMQELVERALAEGAFGMSSGLEYSPGRQTPAAEIAELARVVAAFGGVYATHMRNERDRIVPAVKEAVAIGRETGVTVVISHLKVGRRPNWPSRAEVLVAVAHEVLGIIRDARADGVAIWADAYPYGVPWFLTSRRLAEVYPAYPPETLYLSQGARREWLDQSVVDLAQAWGLSPGRAVERILRTDWDTRVAVSTVDPRVMRLFLAAEFTMVSVDSPGGADIWASPFGPAVHPRAYGTYPRLLGRLVQEEGLLSWEAAVHKATGLPAAVYGLERRGRIQMGYFADIVVVDPLKIRDLATYSQPRQPPVGIDLVMVNGHVVVEGGRLVRVGDGPDQSGLRVGQVLRKAWGSGHSMVP